MCSSVRLWIGYRGRPLNLQRLIVVAYHRTTGVPGQGVNGRLLYLVINRAGQGPTSGGLSMIERRLRHNVLGRANPRVLPTMDRSTRHARKPDWSVITADLLPGPPREGWRNVVNPGVFEGLGRAPSCRREDPNAHRPAFSCSAGSNVADSKADLDRGLAALKAARPEASIAVRFSDRGRLLPGTTPGFSGPRTATVTPHSP
jgi:hypothetical protein